MEKKTVTILLLLPAVLLLAPFVAMRFTEEVAWSPSDFAVAWIFLSGTGLAYKLATARARATAYRTGVALALGTTLLLLWGNLAVGLLGSENNPLNFLYLCVPVTGLIGAAIARLKPAGMGHALVTTALAQTLVPPLAFAISPGAFPPEATRLFFFNALFALLFATSAFLFYRASRADSTSDEKATA